MTDSRKEETTSDTALLEVLEGYAIPVESTDPQEPFERADELSELFEGSRIVALGEATHGTREFFRMKHRLLRHLVRDHGTRLFAMEANFPETLAINEYVLNGEGDPTEALDNIYFWTWNVESVLSVIEWLREFNADRPYEDRVRFYGFDAQYTTGAVSRLESYLDSVDATLRTDQQEDLAFLDDGGTNPDQDERTERQWSTANRLVPELREHLDANRDEYVSLEGKRAWQLAGQHLTAIEQATNYRKRRAEYDGEDAELLESILRHRDEAMADNVRWILDFERPEQAVLWAHDAHINRQKHRVRGTEALETPMGGILHERYGEEYTPLGFSFGRGSFQAMSETGEAYTLQGQTLQEPVTGSFEEILAEFDYRVALVDVAEAADDDRLAELLCSPRPHFSVGATYDSGSPEEYLTEYVFSEAFDAVCYVAETTRARPVDEQVPD